MPKQVSLIELAFKLIAEICFAVVQEFCVLPVPGSVYSKD